MHLLCFNWDYIKYAIVYYGKLLCCLYNVCCEYSKQGKKIIKKVCKKVGKGQCPCTFKTKCSAIKTLANCVQTRCCSIKTCGKSSKPVSCYLKGKLHCIKNITFEQCLVKENRKYCTRSRCCLFEKYPNGKTRRIYCKWSGKETCRVRKTEKCGKVIKCEKKMLQIYNSRKKNN